MKRRNFLRALVAVPVAAALAPLLPAPRFANGKVVDILPVKLDLYDKKLLARAMPNLDYFWSLGFKANHAPAVLDNTKLFRIVTWTRT